MMFMDDCVNGTIEFLEAPSSSLKYVFVTLDSIVLTFRRRTYNLAAVSFSPEELTTEINKQLKAQGMDDLFP